MLADATLHVGAPVQVHLAPAAYPLDQHLLPRASRHFASTHPSSHHRRPNPAAKQRSLSVAGVYDVPIGLPLRASSNPFAQRLARTASRSALAPWLARVVAKRPTIIPSTRPAGYAHWNLYPQYLGGGVVVYAIMAACAADSRSSGPAGAASGGAVGAGGIGSDADPSAWDVLENPVREAQAAPQDCAAWETDAIHLSLDPTTHEPGWEPFGVVADESGRYVVSRRCAP